MKTSFGLDIAGYSTGKLGFAMAQRKNNIAIEVTVYQGHIFSKKFDLKNPLEEIMKKERELLFSGLHNSSLIVDIPIDLQGLPHLNNALYIWQLTQRPVDFAFGALAPFANFIGSPVARFQNLINEGFNGIIGKNIFETYPARSLDLINLPSQNYKKKNISYNNGHWNDGPAAKIAQGLGLVAKKEGETLNDDELDAIICAITGVVDENLILQGDDLKNEICNRIMQKLILQNLDGINVEPPLGYILLKENPKMKILIEKQNL
ncbi:MAG: hypothetical protein M8353_09755 [ANME-2 cluster archaeon]|nr:hypothetical protein [ANME-2 cluster archaeon]